MPQRLVIACVDVGREAGWAYLDSGDADHGASLNVLIDCIASALAAGARVALGLECPLYVPRRAALDGPPVARAGEGNRAWAAPAGLSVLAVGLVQGGAMLAALRSKNSGIRATTRWSEFDSGLAQLLIWEAFVTASGPGIPERLDLPASVTQHQRDALAGARALMRKIAEGPPASDLGEQDVYSLIGMQLIATGFSADLTLLTDRCLVVRARKPE